MRRIKEFIKKSMGFYSPYSWTKWLRIFFAAAALIIACAFGLSFGEIIFDEGIWGFIVALLIFIIIFGPTLAAMLGISIVIGAVVGGIQSGRKQIRSLKESKADDDPEIFALDKLRLKVQIGNLLFLALTIGWLLGTFVLYCYLADSGEVGDMIIVGGVFCAGLIAAVVLGLALASLNKRFQKDFKEQIVLKELANVLTGLDFRPAEKLDENVIRASELFARYDIYSGNDYLAAEYQGISFTQSDVHLRQEQEVTYTDDDGDICTKTEYVTIFHGKLMIFDYDAISNEPVWVRPRRGGQPADENILTELHSFNQQFCVTAKDAASALRILTPPVLTGIVSAREKLNCPLALSFKDDKIYAAIFSGESFESNVTGDTTLSEQRRRITREIQTMLDLVGALYLKK